MDPNACWEEIKRLSLDMNRVHVSGRDKRVKLARLAELTEALDAWVDRGGFVPDEWREGDDACT